MKISPYFSTNYGSVIYYNDWYKIYKSLGKFDLVITAPSWGKAVIMKGTGGFDKDHPIKRREYKDDWDISKPTKNMLDFICSIAKTVIIFGWEHFVDLLPEPNFWITWEKSINHPNRNSTELIWTNIDELEGTKVIDCPWNGIIGKENKGRIHSAQKPVRIFKDIIRFVDMIDGRYVDSLLDPFMGSGTALVAAKELNKKGVGVEIKEKYCQAAKNRLMGIPFDDDFTGRPQGLLF